MYKKRRIAEVGGPRRKSARILALEEKEKEKRKLRAAINKSKAGEGGNVQLSQNEQMEPHGSTTQLSALKRGRMQKRLEEIDFPYLDENQSQQDGEDSDGSNHSIRTGDLDQQVTRLSSMPERQILDYALAVLQRRDTHNIFAQPVDSKEVENYYSIVKEPMDFSTMKAKLQEGRYTSLDQFESDVFLICSNAMHFNSSTTIYYREARAMQLLAQEVFSTMRTDPHKLESEFSLVRGRSTRKVSRKSEIKGLHARTRRPTGVKIGAPSLVPNDDGDSTLTKREDSQFCRPWASFCSENEALVSSVYNAEKTLEIDKKGESKYKQSLISFVRGLGQTAKREAAKKLIKCFPRPQTPSQYTERLLPMPSLAQRTVSHNAQSPITSTQNLPGSFKFLLGRNTFLNLNVKASSSLDRNTIQELSNLMPPPKEPISQPRNDHLQGKRPVLDNIAHNTTNSKSSHEHQLGKMPMLDNTAHNTTNFNTVGSSSREYSPYPSDCTAIYLQPNTYLAQNFDPQREVETQNGQFWLASHLKVIPVEDRNNPYGKKFMTVDMLAEPDDQIEKQGQQSEYAELSANWKPRLRGFVNRGNNLNKSFDLFGDPSETPIRVQSFGSSSAQGMASCDHWQSLTNSNSYTNNSKQIGQPSNGYFNRDEFASLQMLLNNEYTPLPSYEELGVGYQKSGNSAYHHHHGRVNINQQTGLYLKDIDHGPNLSLQL